ncbi:DUF2321 domain-containing protein [Vibrio sp. SCSIO 43145]|nr:DUF2321 domain-containing protein [Vibrio sp. SCSIO 43145]USD46747.1 DUF2321 domain-containing protein [Vibrio sp. SCSIO 43145]
MAQYLDLAACVVHPLTRRYAYLNIGVYMGYYDVQQVCLNGHQITDNYNSSPEFRKNFCTDCGEKTIHKCPECNSDIPGDYHVEGVIGWSSTSVPTHCAHCGSEYPWTKLKVENVENAVKHHDVDHLALVEKLCSRFHLVAKQIKSRYNDRDTLIINDEYDVQDLLHSMLLIHFDDVRAEEWTPSYAGGCSRVDFLLKQEQIVIEVKKTRQSLKGKHVGEQLIVDTERYKVHPDCKKLVCFVYDPDGWVANPRGLENDLNSSDEDFECKVLIVPKGY